MLTEAGEKWALEKAGGSFVFESQEAEFWIRAFCDAVENGSADDFRLRYFEVKRKLLGDGSSKPLL